MKRNTLLAISMVVGVILSGGGVSSALADDVAPVVAPPADGTDGTSDVPGFIMLPDQVYVEKGSHISVAPKTSDLVPMGIGLQICTPGSVSYSVSSATKSGKVTAYGRHIKNDATSETLTFSTSQTVSVGADISVSGTLSANVGLSKIASASLGLTSGFGLNGSYASTASTSRSVTFKTAGKWVIWRGVYTGSGKVSKSVCAGDGTRWTSAGSGSGKTFNKASTTGLTNCANSVTDLLERDAKTKCG